ncbi:hypothetical protein [Fulvitalea axinellae]
MKISELGKSDTLHIYNSPNTSDKFISIFTTEKVRFVHHKSGKEDLLANISTHLNSFRPQFFYPEYSILNPVCIEILPLFYKIKINKSEFKYLLRNKRHRFESFSYLLVQNDILLGTKLTVHQQPDLLSKRVDLKDQNLLSFIRFNRKDSEWIYVEAIKDTWFEEPEDTASEEEKSKSPKGWIRWRKGNDILIHFRLLP